MKSGKCPKCDSSSIYFKEYALDNVTLDGKNVAYVDYVCTDCGYFETYITDKNALSKIPLKAKFNWNNILAVIIAVIAGTLPGSASSFFATFISIPLTGIK